MDKKEYEWAKVLAIKMKLKYGAHQILTSHLLRLTFFIELN
jgi:hypothetical protein